MEKLRRLVEIGSNLAIVFVAVLLGCFAYTRFAAPPVQIQQSSQETDRIKPGTKLELKGVDLSTSDKNLLMVLSTACHFCSESMPFYERLAKENAASHNLRLIAAFPQEVADSSKYLREHNVTVDQVVKATPAQAMVRGTPTLLMLDRNGIVLETWFGKLAPDKESEVLSRASIQLARN